jgi:Zn finger protein HypA/HybF involved in hydrogenase expression
MSVKKLGKASFLDMVTHCIVSIEGSNIGHLRSLKFDTVDKIKEMNFMEPVSLVEVSRVQTAIFVCQNCGVQSPKWLGKCPDCNSWSSFMEERTVNTISRYYLYNGYIYKFDRIDYSSEEILLQIMDLEDKERKQFEHLKHKFSIAQKEETKGKRPTIPEEVRITVWRRDEGKCVKCGSRENLEYDHIIPIAKGGSNTVRNVELLCEKCNREKKDKIGI